MILLVLVGNTTIDRSPLALLVMHVHGSFDIK